MALCPNCGEEAGEKKFCIKCGHPLSNTQTNDNTQNNLNKNDIPNVQETSHQNNIPNQNTHEFSTNTPLQQNNQINNQQTYGQPMNQYGNYQQNNYQQNQNMPQNQKSKIVGLILNMLIVGLGYAYVGKWGEGIVLLVIYSIMFFLGFALLFPFIIALIIWIYSLFKTNEMIDKYNQGLPY